MHEFSQKPLSAFQILGGPLIALILAFIVILAINICSAYIVGQLNGHPICGNDQNCLVAIFP